MMYMYKGFIKTDNFGYVPKTRVKEVKHDNFSTSKTRIVFDDDTYTVWSCSVIKALGILREVENE